MLKTKYGHTRINFKGGEYTLIPSLEAMALIGEREDIMAVFAKLHAAEITNFMQSFDRYSPSIVEMIMKYSRKVTGPQQLAAAHLVLSCCSKDDLSPMIGKYIVKDRVFYQVGFESPQNIIALAKHMMYHGMIGHTTNRQVSNKSKVSASFDPYEFAELARLKLPGMNRDDAWSLTMTEFVALWTKEYPPKEDEKPNLMDLEVDEFEQIIADLEIARDKNLGVIK